MGDDGAGAAGPSPPQPTPRPTAALATTCDSPSPSSVSQPHAPHVTIAVRNGTAAGGAGPNSHQNPEQDGAAQNSPLKRVQTNANILRTIDKSAQVVIRFDNVCAFVPMLVVPGGHGGQGPGGCGGRARSLLGRLPCLPSTPSSAAAAAAGDGVMKSSQEQQEQGQGQQGQAAAKERQILFDISGEVNPGEVLALMGPSGGGKTGLLTAVGGRSTARLEGAVTFNGSRMSKPVKRKLGYVMQDDLLFAELTVYETLYFAALLRLPCSWSRADKLRRVEMVISGLGLERCRDTIIGSHQMRGVSGGERKRVSIGHELLINPSMLLLDEPTSGLDSTTALRLLHTLRSLAHGGRTIVTSIHQPSSRLYRRMDKLMLLAQGRCMYYGDAQSVATWFKRLGQPCPFGTNIADHILDLANGDVVNGNGGSLASGLSTRGLTRRRTAGAGRSGADEEEEEAYGRNGAAADAAGAGCSCSSTEAESGDTAEEVHRRLIEAFEKRTIGRGRGGICASDLEEEEEEEEATRGSAAPPSSSPGRVGGGNLTSGGGNAADKLAMAASSPADDEGQAEGESGAKWGASWMDQVRFLAVRSVKTRRFQSLSIQKTAQLLGVAVLAGLFWWQIGASLDSTQTVLDVGGLLFFVELFMGFATLYAALFTFPLEFQMLVKERQSGMYRLSAYYVARTASDLPLDCLLPSLFVWIIYWMAGLRVDAGAFFAHWASVLLIVLTSQGVGLLIGATVINPQNGQTVATIFMLATMLVGGYYVRGMPAWIAWLKYGSFIYWGWNLLLKIEFRHRRMGAVVEGCVAEAGGGGGGCTVQQAGIFSLDVDAPVTRDVCVLIGMFIFLRLCVYFALRYKTSFKGHR